MHAGVEIVSHAFSHTDSLLSLKLSVWRSKFIINHIRAFHIAIWSVSILATIIPIVTHHVKSGNMCFITPEAGVLFYFPLGFIYVAFAVHVATVIYIANVSNGMEARV